MTKKKKAEILQEERKQEDKEDIAAAERALAEPGPNIPWEEVKKQFGISSRKELAKEARRRRLRLRQRSRTTGFQIFGLLHGCQSRLVRKDPKNKKLIEAWEKIADRTDWKC
jgi:N-acetyl-anhydromuramyl-L-alanine amidase AmpD